MVTFRVSADVGEDRQVVLVLPEGVPTGAVELVVIVASPTAEDGKVPRTSLVEWAEAHAEHWGDELDSSDVERFTGRRFP
jgi:hypothetical protein